MSGDGNHQNANVVHEEPTGIKGALDQILHFWPLLAFIAAGVILVVNTLGEKYVTDIATKVHTNLALDPREVDNIEADIISIKSKMESQVANDVEIRAQLTTIETRLDTLIRIQLEGGNEQ
jgi:hypothetical protein